MSKRGFFSQRNNANELPTKIIKKNEMEENNLNNSNKSLIGETNNKATNLKVELLKSSVSEMHGNSEEGVQLNKNSLEEIAVVGNSKGQEVAGTSKGQEVAGTSKGQEFAGTSKGLERLNFNFWKKSEPKIEKVQVLNENEIKNILKIKQIIEGEFENYSLKVRVTYKSHIKDTTKGKCVSFLVMDESGEISLVSFGKIALKLFEDMEINGIYWIQNFCAYEETLKYRSGSGNKFQIKANRTFIVQQINDDNCVPKISFNFQSIDTIKSQRLNNRVDLIGVMTKDYGLELNVNSNQMRDLHITDRNQGDIIVTLWGGAAENFIGKENSVIVIRKAVVSMYVEVKKLNCISGTLVWMNSKISEVEPLIKWFVEMKNSNEKEKH